MCFRGLFREVTKNVQEMPLVWSQTHSLYSGNVSSQWAGVTHDLRGQVECKTDSEGAGVWLCLHGDSSGLRS